MKALKIVGLALAAILIGLIGYSVSNGNQPCAATAQSNSADQPRPAQIAKAAKCRQVLTADRSKMMQRYDWLGSKMTVEIGAGFDQSDFNSKQALNQLLLCVATQGTMDASISRIDYLDWRSHQVVATWSPYSGLKVGDQ